MRINVVVVVMTGRMPFLLPNQQRQSTEGTDDAYSIFFS